MKNNKGFTFVEILAVIVIIGLLTGISIAAFSRYKENAIKSDYEALARSSYNAMKEYMMSNPYDDTVSLETLENENLLSNRKDPGAKDEDCTGTVEVSKNNGSNGKLDDGTYKVNLCCISIQKTYTYPGGTETNLTDRSKCDYVPEDIPEPPTPGTKYTLRYNDNGGSGCSSKSITKNPGEAWGSLCTPTRSGYKFNGWKNGGTTVTSSSIASGNITVVAQWSANTVKYTLKYNDNGGSGCSSKSITKNKNEAWGSLCTPKRTGYTFNGWYDGSTKYTSSTKAIKNVTVKANWKSNAVPKYTCSAGKYLPKNKTKCEICTSGNYCKGGTWSKNTVDQGLTPCPTGYKNSPAGSSKITQCYMNVVNNHFVKKEKDSSSTPCSSGKAQVAHKVNYGNKSTCIELPKCTIKPSRNSNKLGWYRKNVTLTLQTTGPYTKRGLDKTKKSTNGKTTASVTKEGTTTYYGYVENAVGNSTCSITIQLDKTPPTLKDYKYYVHNNVQSHSSANRLNQPSGSWPGKFKVKLRSVTSTDKLSGVYAYYMYFEPTVLVNTTIYRPSGKNIPNKTDTPLPLTSSDCKKVRHYVEEIGAYSTGYFCKKDDLINKVQEYPISVPSSADHYNFDWCGGIKVYDKAGNMITTSQGDDNNKKVANRSGMGSNSQCIKVNHANNNSTIFTFKKF